MDSQPFSVSHYTVIVLLHHTGKKINKQGFAPNPSRDSASWPLYGLILMLPPPKYWVRYGAKLHCDS